MQAEGRRLSKRYKSAASRFGDGPIAIVRTSEQLGRGDTTAPLRTRTFKQIGCYKRWPLRCAAQGGIRGAGSRCASQDLRPQNLPRSIGAPSHERGNSQSRERRARIGGVMRPLDGAPDMRVRRDRA